MMNLNPKLNTAITIVCFLAAAIGILTFIIGENDLKGIINIFIIDTIQQPIESDMNPIFIDTIKERAKTPLNEKIDSIKVDKNTIEEIKTAKPDLNPINYRFNTDSINEKLEYKPNLKKIDFKYKSPDTIKKN